MLDLVREMKKCFLQTAIIMIALLSVAPVTLASDDRPNILWILSDDHSPMNGSYGDAYATTPNIDAIAEKGTRYANAFSNAPVCSTARSTLITGIFPTALGTQNMRSVVHTPDDVTYFPSYMAKAGYYTVNVAKHDFNMFEPEGAWTERVKERAADWDRARYFKETGGKKPFFAIVNLGQAHESRIRRDMKGNRRKTEDIIHSVDDAPVPAYFPDTRAVRETIAQYYDNVTEVDTNVGLILKNLIDDGLADNTIVFFFADHGTGVARSKRWPYNSGLQVPFVLHVPEKYKHLAPTKAGGVVDEMVSFVDFAPTALSLAGVDVPDYMMGRVFLGPNKEEAPEYTFGFRDRMDERFDLIRTARDKRFQYIRNYLPDLPYSQYVNTLYRLQPIMSEWHKGLEQGKLNEAQGSWFLKKPSEELYDLENDPDEVNNLAKDPAYADVAARMGKAIDDWVKDVKDVGFLTEAEHGRRAGEHGQSIYDLARNSDVYPFDDIYDAANMASSDTATLADHLKNLKGSDPAVRYWGAAGLIRIGRAAEPAMAKLETALRDKYAIVRIKAAEALCRLEACDKALPVLVKELVDGKGAGRLLAINTIDHLDDLAISALPTFEKLAAELAKIKTASGLGKGVPGDEAKIQANMHTEYTKRVLNKTIRDLKDEKSYTYIQ